MAARQSLTENSATGLREAVPPVVAALVLGVFLVFAAGFAGPEVVHNAAHDSRHAFTFPCH
ncbi:MAG TPA: CbtB domain-containing protein [Alphaproteobacteria bacterium]|nr:CbtB domain-containing protein [Alphaproteobacteria bacterium]HSE77863.1 CbtB domain-containing protein [Alphaproteobacteria bacterium]